jgi:hypothetical protein
LQHFKINHQQAAEPLAVISAEVHAPLSPVCAPPLPPLSNVALEPVLCSMPQIHHDKVTANIIPEKKKKEELPKQGKATNAKKKRQPSGKMKELITKEVKERLMMQGKIL